MVTVHSVTINLRKSILNSLREWDLLTPESLSYGLCSECKVLYDQQQSLLPKQPPLAQNMVLHA